MSKTSRKELAAVAGGVAVAGRRRRKGTLLIALGLVVAAGAVALLVSGRKQEGGTDAPATAPLPPVERRDALAAERSATHRAAPDDAVGDAERKIDNALTGKPKLAEQPDGRRRGRHAARE